jgi:hypothetical protein
MKPAKIIKSSFLLFTFYFLLSAKISFAQTATNGLSAIPPRLEIEVVADKVTTQAIKVRNESTETKTITVSIRDFIVSDNQGTPEFIDNLSDAVSNRWAASSWIQVSPTSLTLKPGETKGLSLTVMPPKNALPGGHYAAVIYSPNATSIGASTGASVQTNVGTLVYVTVPGDISQSALVQSFSAPKFSEFGPIDFKSTIKNSSDIHIQPVGAITVKNWLGGKTAQLTLNQTNIFPYTTRDFQNTLDKKWLFGRYKATMQAVYGTAGGLITATIFFWVIPWRLILLIIAAIAIITALITVLKKKPTTPKSSDTEVAQLEKELEELKKKYKD